MLADLGFWSWLLIALVLAAVVLVWWGGCRLRKKAREDFYRMIDSDIGALLLETGHFAPGEVDRHLAELKTAGPCAALHPALLQIEYALSCRDVNKVSRVVSVAFMDRENRPAQNKIEREYDWDFVPDDLGDSLILSHEQNINVPIYTKKTQ